MNSDRNPPHVHSAGDDSSWESLAENLFGIDLTEDDLAAIPEEDLTLDDELLGTTSEGLQESEVEQPLEAAESASAADQASATADAVEDVGEEFDDEADVRLIEGELVADVEVEPEASDDDDYWDALDDWDWGQDDTEPATESPKQARHDRSSARSSRSLSRAAAEDADTDWKEARGEYIDDSDFGVGLLDDGLGKSLSESDSDPDNDQIGEAAEAGPTRRSAEDKVDPREGRGGRKRRRRRSGGRDGDHEDDRDEATKAPRASQFEDKPSEDEPSEDKPAVDEDAFGAGLDLIQDRLAAPDEERRDDRSPAKKPRRGRRRRRPRDEAADRESGAGREADVRSESTQSALDDEESTVEEVWDADDEADEQRKSRYSSVPTWEEAVALLKRPRRSDSERSSGRSASREGRSGGRRGRRRR